MTEPGHYRYLPAAALGDEPHIVVDGAPRPGTVLTLSHWPGTPTPPALWRDVSAGIVRAALADRAAMPVGVDAVTIDHYDADGVLSLALLVVPGVSDTHGPLVERAATAGDFDVVDGRDAAMVAFALAGLGDHDRALAVMPRLLADPEGHRELWGDEMAAYDASVAMVEAGSIVIEERPELDLAVVRVDTRDRRAAEAAWDGAALHPGAVHSRTGRYRVLTVAGGRLELRYRYETWVRLAERPARLRVDLELLATRLTAAETDGALWVFDGAGAIVGALHRADDGPSTVEPERFVDLAVAELERLDNTQPAWDPYR